jgi:glucan phosphoethanolaminetransferase (alkaline phosphatase superfamily)
MESISSEKIDLDNNTKKGIFKNIFSFDSDNKSDLLNLGQFSILASVLVVLGNKVLHLGISHLDDEKNKGYILVQLLIEILFIVIFLYIATKIITSIPTLSKKPYGPISILSVILPILFLLIKNSPSSNSEDSTISDKISAKVNYLAPSLQNNEYFSSNASSKKKRYANQPIVNSNSTTNPTSNLSLIPGGGVNTSNPMGNTNVSPPIPDPDFNTMFAGPDTPLQHAQTPGLDEQMIPQAANGVLGTGW